MRILIAIPLLALILATRLGAVVSTIDLSFDQLTLRNGKVFPAATIKSYDSEKNSVVISADRTLTTVQIELLPDDVAARVRSLASTAVVPPASEAPAKKAPAKSSAKKRGPKAPPEATPPAANRQEEFKAAAAAMALQYASTRFGFPLVRDARGGLVPNPALQLEDPEPIPGWEGRYRMKGQVGAQVSDQYGSRLSRKPTEFEIVIETTPAGKPKITELIVHKTSGL
jgi:hypothetical protein